MNKETIDLSFLYHHKKLILGAEDPVDKAMSRLSYKFGNEMISMDLKKALGVIIVAFKDSNPNHRYFDTCFYDVNSSLGGRNEPVHVRDQDLYMPKSKMARADVEYSLLKLYKNPEGPSISYLEELEIGFVNPQEFGLFVDPILEGKTFIRNSFEDSVIYKVEDSPIAKIEITPLKFVLTINQEYWVAYRW